jgi:GNAT superfamily N-acetyltransferase
MMAAQIVRFDDPVWRGGNAGGAGGVEVAELEGLKELVDASLRPPEGILLLAYDAQTAEKVLGTAGFTRVAPGVCETRRVVVGWDYQRHGIGHLLMAALLEAARGMGFQGMRAQVPADVPALVGFYEREGFAKSPAEFQVAGVVRLERRL